MNLQCPHCQSTQSAAGRLCSNCGIALPNATNPFPPIAGSSNSAIGQVADQLKASHLRKQMRGASVPLFALAALQLLVGGIVFGLSTVATQGQGQQAADVQALGIGILVIGSVFLGLGFWARKAPMPAALTGLVLYIALLVFDGVLEPANIHRGLLIKVIIILALVKSVSAGMKYRELRSQMRSAPPEEQRKAA